MSVFAAAHRKEFGLVFFRCLIVTSITSIAVRQINYILVNRHEVVISFSTLKGIQ